MDAKKQIDDALSEIGKDRKWLAEVSGYSYFSVRDCLAPDGKKLSTRMERAFREAIQSIKDTMGAPPPLPDRITLEVHPYRMNAYLAASIAENQDVKSWAIDKLNDAAERWRMEQDAQKERQALRIAEEEDPT